MFEIDKTSVLVSVAYQLKFGSYRLLGISPSAVSTDCPDPQRVSLVVVVITGVLLTTRVTSEEGLQHKSSVA